MTPEFLNSLKSYERVLYKASYKFHIENISNDPEAAHQAGLLKIKKTKILIETETSPENRYGKN